MTNYSSLRGTKLKMGLPIDLQVLWINKLNTGTFDHLNHFQKLDLNFQALQVMWKRWNKPTVYFDTAQSVNSRLRWCRSSRLGLWEPPPGTSRCPSPSDIRSGRLRFPAPRRTLREDTPKCSERCAHAWGDTVTGLKTGLGMCLWNCANAGWSLNSPWYPSSLHLVGHSDVSGPDVVLPALLSQDATKDRPAVDPYSHVYVCLRLLSHVTEKETTRN